MSFPTNKLGMLGGAALIAIGLFLIGGGFTPVVIIFGLIEVIIGAIIFAL